MNFSLNNCNEIRGVVYWYDHVQRSVYRRHLICPGLNFLLSCWIWIIPHNYCTWPISVSWPWIKVISPRSNCTQSDDPFPGRNSLLLCSILIIIHTIVVHDPRVCHVLEPRSYLQGQTAHIAIILVQAIMLPFWIWIFRTIVVNYPRMCYDLEQRSCLLRPSSHCTHSHNPCPCNTLQCEVGFGYLTQLLSMTNECVMTLTKCHTAHTAIILIRTITHHYHVKFAYFTQLLSMTKGCVMVLNQCHISRVKIILHK